MSEEEIVPEKKTGRGAHLIPFVPGERQRQARELGLERRRMRKFRYLDDVEHAEDLMAKSLGDAAKAAVAIVKGEARAYLINHKTGTVEEVPVDPATRLKAAEFIFKRIAGEPERQTTVELGEEAKGVFNVMVGAAASEFWRQQSAETQLIETQDQKAIEAKVEDVSDVGGVNGDG